MKATIGMRGLALGAALIVSAPALAGGIVYVDDDAPPAGDGTSWETAFRFLQDGLAAAAKGSVSEVRVGQGLQLPDRNEANPKGTQSRDESFTLLNDVAVRGGYAGLGAGDPDVRDVDAFATVLSGDLLGNDGPNFENTAENAFRVVTAEGTDMTAALDGFTVRAANGRALRIRGSVAVASCTFEANQGFTVDEADGTSTFTACSFVGNSGSHAFQTRGSATLTDCRFTDNVGKDAAALCSSGPTRLVRCVFTGHQTTFGTPGAVDVSHEATVFEACLFEDNVGKSAGAVYARGGTFIDCTFRRNHAAVIRGGAIFIAGPVTLDGCRFEANTAVVDGGAVVNYGGEDSVVILDCSFVGNEANRGGGVFNFRAESTLVIGCEFIANRAQRGAGLYDDRARTVVKACLFEGNLAIDGAGMVNDDQSEPEITDCDFVGNQAARNGGGIANFVGSNPVIRACRFQANEAQEGAGIFSQIESEPLITGCMFEANRAVRGAGISNSDDTRPVILESTFLGNVATSAGGGIANTDSEVIIGGCAFLGNRATGLGGGLHSVVGSVVTVTNSVFSGNIATEGGAVRSFDSDQSLINCTFVSNGAAFGAALSSLGGSETLVANCVLWSNGADPIDAGPITVRYSLVEGGHPGVGNLDADPLLADPLGPDGIAGTPDDDLRLLVGSPAIDAGDGDALPGDINLDFDGAPRYVDDPDVPDTGTGEPTFIDLGAFELQVACAGDVDGDGSVGFSDVLAVLAAWGPCAGCAEDIDGDGEVGFSEVLIVLGAWGACQ